LSNANSTVESTWLTFPAAADENVTGLTPVKSQRASSSFSLSRAMIVTLFPVGTPSSVASFSHS
jgi:hypothetical protein